MKAWTSLALTVTWLVLVGITLTSWVWGSAPGLLSRDARWLESIAVLVLAFVKIRLVMRRFMGVGEAPAVLRWICDGWIVCTCLALVITIRVV